MRIEISQFGGTSPRTDPYLLDNSQAQIARDVEIGSGALEAWREEVHVQDISISTAKSVYKWVYNTGGDSKWVVDADYYQFVRSPLSSDAYYRVYYSGEAELRYLSNNDMSTPFNHTTDYLKLGITAPTAAITTVGGYTAGGSGYKAWVYTYVNRFGEEGPPSPVRSISDWSAGTTFRLTGFSQPPTYRAVDADKGGLKPMVRIYRTNSSASGAAFQYVGYFYVSAVTTWSTHYYDDTVLDANLGEVIPSVTWLPPISGLLGLNMLSCGSLVAYYGKQLWFSEPNYPHAFPLGYMLAFEYEIKGIGVFGNTVAVLTNGYPFLVVGDLPGQMQKIKLPGLYPCSSSYGVASSESGVFYPSYAGLVLVDQNGAKLVGTDRFTKRAWRTYYPQTFRSTFWSGKYIAFYYDPLKSVGTPGYCWGFVYDTVENSVADIVFRDASFVDRDDILYTVKSSLPGDKAIYKWDESTTGYRPYTWKSKKFAFPSNAVMSVFKVRLNSKPYADLIDEALATDLMFDLNEALYNLAEIGGAVDEDEINLLSVNEDFLYGLLDFQIDPNVNFKFFVDGILMYEKTVSVLDFGKVFKLPKTVNGETFEVEISGRMPVEYLAIATGVRELMYG